VLGRPERPFEPGRRDRDLPLALVIGEQFRDARAEGMVDAANVVDEHGQAVGLRELDSQHFRFRKCGFDLERDLAGQLLLPVMCCGQISPTSQKMGPRAHFGTARNVVQTMVASHGRGRRVRFVSRVEDGRLGHAPRHGGPRQALLVGAVPRDVRSVSASGCNRPPIAVTSCRTLLLKSYEDRLMIARSASPGEGGTAELPQAAWFAAFSLPHEATGRQAEPGSPEDLGRRLSSGLRGSPSPSAARSRLRCGETYRAPTHGGTTRTARAREPNGLRSTPAPRRHTTIAPERHGFGSGSS
jgi:hypothetical protein